MDLPEAESQDSLSPARQILSVSELNHLAREILEANFPLIWVQGEISNLARPASGHWYFSLKDDAAQVRCAMFKMRNRLLPFQPGDGQQVLARARVGLYEPRGEYQLIIDHMEPAGEGALRLQFEMLKKRLATEGLFDEQLKQPLPGLPRRIGVITSPTGAAIRDVLSVLKRRFPAIPVMIYPTQVQGATAAGTLIQAINTANRRGECDALILCRGGGSLEDLWAFNDEQLARVIAASDIPIVSGIGHEVDFTIADFVADLRAPTPSAAAELLTPAAQDWWNMYAEFALRFTGLIQRKLATSQQQLSWIINRLQHPRRRLQSQAQRTDELEQRLVNAQKSNLRHQQHRLATLRAQLEQYSPLLRLNHYQMESVNLQKRLHRAMQHQYDDRCKLLAATARALEAVSPLATLGRGYAIVKKLPEQSIVRQTGDVQIGMHIETQLSQGRIISTVEELQPEYNLSTQNSSTPNLSKTTMSKPKR
jgi:exodeoxyribonuclease VII large subunit